MNSNWNSNSLTLRTAMHTLLVRINCIFGSFWWLGLNQVCLDADDVAQALAEVCAAEIPITITLAKNLWAGPPAWSNHFGNEVEFGHDIFHYLMCSTNKIAIRQCRNLNQTFLDLFRTGTLHGKALLNFGLDVKAFQSMFKAF